MTTSLIKDALQFVQSGLQELTSPGTAHQVMVFAADGTPTGRVRIAGLSEAAYGTCATASDVAAKTVAITDFLLVKNCVVSVFFNNAIATTTSTLNVTSTGDKPIWYMGAALTQGVVRPRTIVTLQYDGTRWNIIAISGLQTSDAPDLQWVDLGLPSGLKWAKSNLTYGSVLDGSAVENYGSFFPWGATTGYSPDTAAATNEAFAAVHSFTESTYADLPAAAITANLAPSMDAARTALGSPWRLPTPDEWQELYDQCTWVWTTQNGVNGWLATSKANSKTLFLPAAGYADGNAWVDLATAGHYLTSSLISGDTAATFSFTSTSITIGSPDQPRYRGLSLRPVF